MSSEGKLPSIAQLQKFVREKTSIEVTCLDGKSSRFTGTLKWFDETALALQLEDGGEITLLRGALLGYRPKKSK